MPIAITEDHRMLAEVAAELLARHDATGEARRLLDGGAATLPAHWPALPRWAGSGSPSRRIASDSVVVTDGAMIG